MTRHSWRRIDDIFYNDILNILYPTRDFDLMLDTIDIGDKICMGLVRAWMLRHDEERIGVLDRTYSSIGILAATTLAWDILFLLSLSHFCSAHWVFLFPIFLGRNEYPLLYILAGIICSLDASSVLWIRLFGRILYHLDPVRLGLGYFLGGRSLGYMHSSLHIIITNSS